MKDAEARRAINALVTKLGMSIDWAGDMSSKTQVNDFYASAITHTYTDLCYEVKKIQADLFLLMKHLGLKIEEVPPVRRLVKREDSDL